MLLRRFSDDDEWLHCCYRANTGLKIFKTRIENVFTETHLYTKYDESGQKDVGVEEFFYKLEGSTSRIIDEIVDNAINCRKAYQLNEVEKDILLCFFLHLRRRFPGSRYYVEQEVAKYFGQIPNAFEEYVGRPCTPEEIAQIESPEYRIKILKNMFPEFAAARPRGDTKKMFKNASVLVGLISKPNKNFVIGSRLTDQFSEWIPVHQRVAIRFVPFRSIGQLNLISNHMEIRRINENIANRSDLFAGLSEELVRSFS